MAKLNLGKVENGGTTANGKLSAADVMSIQASVNAIYDFLFTNGIIGPIKDSALSDGLLSSDQFETLTDKTIGIKTSYLQSLGLGGGGTGQIKLATPAPTATVISTTQINLNCPVVPNANGYTWERATNSSFTDAVVISAGSSPNYNNTGLAQNTTYYYRVKATTTNSAYTDSNYAGTLATTNSSGATTPSAPTLFIVNDVANTGDWTANSTYPTLADYEYTLDGGVTFSQVTAKPFTVGDIAKAVGQVGVRVKAASGRNPSAWLFNVTAYTSTGGGTYIVERTFLLNFANQYGPYPDNPPPYWNTFKPDDSALQTVNGFTSPNLVDNVNAASTLVVKNSGAFGGSTARLSSEQEAAGDTGVFKNDVVNTAWSFSGSTTAKINISGLNTAKFYQIYILLPVSSASSVRGATIGGVVKNKTATTILGSFGLAANGLNDSEFIVFNNISGTSLEIALNRVSGDFGAFLSSVIIEQSNIAK